MCDDLQFDVSSKKIVDPNEQEGESILLSELHGEIFEPTQVLNQKKGSILLLEQMIFHIKNFFIRVSMQKLCPYLQIPERFCK